MIKSGSDLPRHIRGAFNCVIDWARCHLKVVLYLQGSIAKGGVDEYSDLDFVIVMGDQASAATSRDLREHIGRNYPILTEFSSGHIAKYSARILYIEVEGWVVKLDMCMRAEDIHIGDGATMLVDLKSGDLSRAQGKLITTIDVLPLFEKMCGWLWFTYSRIARGEYFAAARSIEFTRETALLPVILDRLGFEQDGHRRLETRLPAALLNSLKCTHPSRLEKEELFKALSELYQITIDEAVKRSGEVTGVAVRMRRVWAIIEDRHNRSPSEKSIAENPWV